MIAISYVNDCNLDAAATRPRGAPPYLVYISCIFRTHRTCVSRVCLGYNLARIWRMPAAGCYTHDIVQSEARPTLACALVYFSIIVAQNDVQSSNARCGQLL